MRCAGERAGMPGSMGGLVRTRNGRWPPFFAMPELCRNPRKEPQKKRPRKVWRILIRPSEIFDLRKVRKNPEDKKISSEIFDLPHHHLKHCIKNRNIVNLVAE